MASSTVTLTPSAAYYQYSWSGDGEWSENEYGIKLRYETLIKMPGTSVTPSQITNITLNGSTSFTENENAGNRTFQVGFATSLYQPSSVTECTAYISSGTTQIAFAVTPSVSISGTWYLYVYDKNDDTDFTINSVTITYAIPTTACGAPTACAVDDTLSTGNVTLSWSGATAGTDNAITGYEVQRAESSDGSSWGSWASLGTTSDTSLSVAPPTTAGNYYKFRVRTLGAAGSSYYSGWKESTNTLRRDHAPLAAFTDTLTAGVTPIKALHMTELQNAVNTLRTFYGLSAYSFTTITAGTTSLGGWSAHVAEIRAAVDELYNDHETWISISVNCPRVDVMEQLRAVVLAI